MVKRRKLFQVKRTKRTESDKLSYSLFQYFFHILWGRINYPNSEKQSSSKSTSFSPNRNQLNDLGEFKSLNRCPLPFDTVLKYIDRSVYQPAK